MPKSVSFTTPCRLTSTLAGLTSRWMTPVSSPSLPRSECAESSARATSRVIWRVWASVGLFLFSASAARMVSTLWPSMNSMTMNSSSS